MAEPENKQQVENVGEVNPETVPFGYPLGSNEETRRRTSFRCHLLFMNKYNIDRIMK